jgi:hypothetical protein
MAPGWKINHEIITLLLESSLFILFGLGVSGLIGFFLNPASISKPLRQAGEIIPDALAAGATVLLLTLSFKPVSTNLQSKPLSIFSPLKRIQERMK